jgi:hypothetical protein
LQRSAFIEHVVEDQGKHRRGNVEHASIGCQHRTCHK